jgi:phosphotransferase system HPr (HPr) family protein
MPKRVVRLATAHGLHARPCSQVAEAMRRFRGRLVIRLRGREADARSVLEMMGLEAEQGALLELRADGEDADAILDSVQELLQ